MIDSVTFGAMTINGKRLSSDLIIFPDGHVADSWWRDRGHYYTLKDIQSLVDAKPEIIVAGTGMSGMVRVDPKLKGILSDSGIDLKAMPTPDAIKVFNQLIESNRVGGCFHLTC